MEITEAVISVIFSLFGSVE